MTLPTEIDVWQGDIAELEVDGIIIPANESLFMTAPISATVRRAAGEEVERAAVARGPVAPGEVVVTGGGRLAAPYIVHAVAVGHDLQPDRERVVHALNAALDVAAHLALRRMAMAPLGTERGVFPPSEAAAIILETLEGRAAQGRALPESLVLAVGAAEASTFRAAVEALKLATAGTAPAPPVAGEGG
jgi:O-acetyl-ADP-ribose deacetylase (regulator of RNase III)